MLRGLTISTSGPPSSLELVKFCPSTGLVPSTSLAGVQVVRGTGKLARGETEGLVTWPACREVQQGSSWAKFYDDWEPDKGRVEVLVLCSFS